MATLFLGGLGFGPGAKVSHAKACAPSADYFSSAMIRVDGGLNRSIPGFNRHF
jgi:hypothetical protein